MYIELATHAAIPVQIRTYVRTYVCICRTVHVCGFVKACFASKLYTKCICLCRTWWMNNVKHPVPASCSQKIFEGFVISASCRPGRGTVWWGPACTSHTHGSRPPAWGQSEQRPQVDASQLWERKGDTKSYDGHKEVSLKGGWTVSHSELITGSLTPEPHCCTRTVLSSLGDGHSVQLTENQWSPPSHGRQKMNEPQTAVLPLWGSSVWRTDGCVGMTCCLCIHPQCKHLWFNKGRQGGYSLRTGNRVKGVEPYHMLRWYLLTHIPTHFLSGMTGEAITDSQSIGRSGCPPGYSALFHCSIVVRGEIISG